MKLAIVSDLMLWRSGDRPLAAPPGDVMEIHALSGLCERIQLIGLAGDGPPPPHAVALDTRIEVFTATVAGGRGGLGKLRALGGCLRATPALRRTLAEADLVHLRCPSKLAWTALALLTPRLERPRIWARWGGEAKSWPGEPLSYRLQRRALEARFAGATTTTVGPGGLPNPTRTAAQLAEAERRTRAKRLDNPLRLLFAARLSPDKGGETVLAAAAALARRGWPMRLDIAGDGPEKRRLAAAAHRLGLERSVVFHGWLGAEALDALAAEAHFALLPSRTEGFPRALREAMALRAVPLASPAGAIPQTLAPIDPRLLLPADNPQCWADCIESIASRPNEWRRLADASRAVAAACSTEAFREAVLDMWERTLGTEPARGSLGGGTMTAALILGPHVSGHGDSIKVCEELAERLRGAGWPIWTASHRQNGFARTLDAVAAALRWRRLYHVAQVDVFSGRAFLWSEAVCLALEAAKKPFVLTLHGGDLPAFAARHPARVARLLKAARRVTAPSAYLQQALSSAGRPIELLPNAIDLGRCRFVERPHPRPRLIWLRAFHDLYNSVLAVETLAALRPDFPETTLRMIGPDRGDGELGRCRAKVRSLALDEAVRFDGPVPKPETPRRLELGDIFLNTSSVDNTPVSVLEAMACGLPIVSTRVGGIPALLDDGRDALLTSADPQAMAAAVRRLLTEPGLALHLSQNARRKAEQLDWSTVLPRWQALLEEAAR